MLNTICSKINRLTQENETICIAIDGQCGSGKTTLAQYLSTQYNCNVFHMDDFFLPPKLRTKERLNQAGGNVDYKRFKKDVLDQIRLNDEFEYQPFHCKTMSLGDARVVQPKALNIIEGSYSMHPQLISQYQLTIFLTVDVDKQHERIEQRNGKIALQQFVNKWIPLETTYFKQLNIETKANIVVNTTNNILGCLTTC